MVKKVLR